MEPVTAGLHVSGINNYVVTTAVEPNNCGGHTTVEPIICVVTRSVEPITVGPYVSGTNNWGHTAVEPIIMLSHDSGTNNFVVTRQRNQ